jgi:cobalt-zinc-cadmium efflux system membrane fusion protein
VAGDQRPEPALSAPEVPVRSALGWLKNVAVTVAFLAALAGFLIFVGIVPAPWKAWAAAPPPPPPAPVGLLSGVELVEGQSRTVAVPVEVQRSLGIRKGAAEMVAVAKPPTQMQAIVLPGSTALDPTRLYRIRARFAPARVIEIAQVRDDVATQKEGRSVFRELRNGDPVKKGDLLGVFYSVDCGNKKSDLTDAISQRFLDEEILDKAQDAYRKGALAEIFMLNAQRNVEADRGAETRAVNHLRTWDIPEAEIKACYDEAEKLRKLNGRERDLARIEKNKEWPRVELRAPDDGILVERNVCQGEMIVDATVNLFQIARVDRLLVQVNAPEDYLPTLNKLLKTTDHKWTVTTVGANTKKGIEGTIDEVGYLIDPNQHTAIVKGHIDNPGGVLRAGQFVSASIPVPPPTGVVEVPIDAVSEDGRTVVVFVQPDPAKPQYAMRRVQLKNRFSKTAFVRSEPFATISLFGLVFYEEAWTAEEKALGVPPLEPLRPGERVLTTAVGELKRFVLEKESLRKKEPKEDARESK